MKDRKTLHESKKKLILVVEAKANWCIDFQKLLAPEKGFALVLRLKIALYTVTDAQ